MATGYSKSHCLVTLSSALLYKNRWSVVTAAAHRRLSVGEFELLLCVLRDGAGVYWKTSMWQTHKAP